MHRHLTLAGVLLVVGAGCPSSDPAEETTTAGSGGIETLSGTDTTDPSDSTTGENTTDPDGSGSSSSGELNCGEQEFVLEAVPPNVVLVLDKSGSMVQNSWDADGDPMTAEETRWRSLHDVVSFVVGTFEAEINFGATLFPSTSAIAELGEGACFVNEQPEVPVAALNGDGVLAGIPPADATTTTINGATPATAGVQTALEHLKTLDDSIDRFMILITDGAANCSADADTSMCPGVDCGLMVEYDTNLPAVVGEAFMTDGVPTYVIGIDIVDDPDPEPAPGQVVANTFAELNTVAEAGGRARDGAEKFFNATNEIELQDALAEIAGQVVSCTIPLNPEPTAPAFVEIEIGGTAIEHVEDCATEDGWVYVNPDGPYDAIELCNAACDSLAESGELDATFGCPPSG